MEGGEARRAKGRRWLHSSVLRALNRWRDIAQQRQRTAQLARRVAHRMVTQLVAKLYAAWAGLLPDPAQLLRARRVAARVLRGFLLRTFQAWASVLCLVTRLGERAEEHARRAVLRMSRRDVSKAFEQWRWSCVPALESKLAFPPVSTRLDSQQQQEMHQQLMTRLRHELHLEAATIRREMNLPSMRADAAELERLSDETKALRREVKEMARTRSELLHLVVRADTLGKGGGGGGMMATAAAHAAGCALGSAQLHAAAGGEQRAQCYKAHEQHAAEHGGGGGDGGGGGGGGGGGVGGGGSMAWGSPPLLRELMPLGEMDLPGVTLTDVSLLQVPRQQSPFLTALHEAAPLSFPHPNAGATPTRGSSFSSFSSCPSASIPMRARGGETAAALMSPPASRAPVRPASARVGIKAPSPRLARHEVR